MNPKTCLCRDTTCQQRRECSRASDKPGVGTFGTLRKSMEWLMSPCARFRPHPEPTRDGI